MKRVWTIVVLVLVGTALLVPLSSKRPDAVQKVLGMRGGVESTPGALCGILLVFAGAALVAYILSRKKGPPAS